MIQIIPIGGYGEVGKNMTALRVDNEIIILDMGIHLPNYIKCTEDEEEDIKNLSTDYLRENQAIPDDSIIEQWRDQVIGIVTTHAHLDHIGAIPFLARKYNCPIICTRFTSEVIKAIVNDEKITLKNSFKVLNTDDKYKLSSNIKVEFVNVTHSTPQTVCVVLHTKYGKVVYANDFKFDNHPTIGNKPNYRRFKELGREGVLALITDSLYANREGKMPGELIVREMLKEVILDTDSKGKAIIITTFASHLARLKSIVEFSSKLNRKIVFMGRSLCKYVTAGENTGIVKFSNKVELVKYGNKIKKMLKKIEKHKEKYVLIVTGHQGEPQAVLSKMANGIMPFRFNPGDHLIFSCNTIPTDINIHNREVLEGMLKKKGVSIYKDVHVSGHAAREDLRDFLDMLKPFHVIPTHSEQDRMEAFKELALEQHIPLERIHLVNNGEIIELA